MNSAFKSRSIFNLTLCSLIGLSVGIFYTSLVYLNLGFTGTSWVGMVAVFAGLIASSVMINKVGNIPIQLVGFVLMPMLLGVTSSHWLKAVDPSILQEAMLVTMICVGVAMILSALFPSVFRRIIGILVISLVVIILTSLVSSVVFHIHLSSLDYASVFVFMGFLGYDIAESKDAPPTLTWAIAISGRIFLDVLNIFTSIVGIFDE